MIGIPPTDERTVSAYAAGRALGVYSSTVERWIAAGLLKGGKLQLPGRERLVWWVSVEDLNALIAEGGRWAGIEKRKDGAAELEVEG